MIDATLVVPYYRNVAMLREQAREWLKYPPELRVVLVDDGSPEPAIDVVREVGHSEALSIYRIRPDIPWNRGGARNLGAYVAMTRWLVHVDIDHLLRAEAARRLIEADHDPLAWYRFIRYRRGRADETRRKDKIPESCEFGLIHPHIDSYLITRDLYWKTGGYDEDYSGCLGGGSPFLKRLEQIAPMRLLGSDIPLEVFTRSAVGDASDHTLSRDTAEYTRRRQAKEKAGKTTPKNPLRFEWTKAL